ncbi:MAG: SDR family oxidoreductase [Alphaproteobacteria bacterium]|nr:SDR family oxidoreductase [Alphaproteobacteria bacterium]
MPTVLVTGASRGIGLEFVRQYARAGWRIEACCRDPGGAKALKDIAASEGGRMRLHALDVIDGASVAAARRSVGDTPLDLLINNAGIYGKRGETLGNTDFEEWKRVFDVDVLGPMRVAEAFIDLLALGREPRLISISSRMGSIAETSGGSLAYRSSKAALNMVNRNLSLELRSRGIGCFVFHPGWVQTDMGGSTAPVTPERSVTGMRKVIAGLSLAQTGGFFDFEGNPIPW